MLKNTEQGRWERLSDARLRLPLYPPIDSSGPDGDVDLEPGTPAIAPGSLFVVPDAADALAEEEQGVIERPMGTEQWANDIGDRPLTLFLKIGYGLGATIHIVF